MANPLLTGIGLATLLAASGAAGAAGTSVASPAGDATANPLLAPWTGPYGGVPPFDRAKVEHFQPALEAAMAEKLAEIDGASPTNPEPATFENTIAALERAGRTLDRVRRRSTASSAAR